MIDWDGSKKNRKDFFFINPPIVNKDLGVRKSIFDESLPVLKHLKEHSMQTIVFGRSRLTVENFLRASKYYFSGTDINLSAYRSGYTQQERRSIENRLKIGDLDVVISTIALELGINMGMVDAIVMLGYPGSISGFLQQTGRAGREDRPSASVLIASASPVDQFIVHHPEFVAGKNPESVQINPDNPLILINHLKCAAFELPFREQEGYGKLANAEVLEYLNVLMNLGMLHRDQRKYYWKSTLYPSSGFSIRGISGNPIQIIQKGRDGVKVIGEVDRSSAKRVVFPGAIYLHNGQSYEVLSLELEEDRAIVIDHHDDELTIPIISVDIKIINSMESNSLQNVEIGLGEIEVTEEVSGYKIIIPETREIIEKSNLDFEKDVMQTQGIWFAFEKPFVEQLNCLNLWTNSKNIYGPDWKDIRKAILKRDNFLCVLCGNHFPTTQLEVHHIKPFRTFSSIEEANHERNLAVLCSSCHKIAERNVRTVSLLNGFGHAFLHLSTILLKCNLSDISYSVIENIGSKNNMPGIVIYDQYPGGIGLSQHLFHNTNTVIDWIEELLSDCECTEGCPACVGPPGENGSGAKRAVLEMVSLL